MSISECLSNKATSLYSSPLILEGLARSNTFYMAELLPMLVFRICLFVTTLQS